MKSAILFSLVIANVIQGLNGTRCGEVSRSAWRAREPKATTPMEDPATRVFIHHTDTRNCTSFSSCTRLLRSIQNYHMDNRGWDDIGYNFLIGGDGVYTGRGWSRQGAHTSGYNRLSIGLALIGNFSSAPPPLTMQEATIDFIKCAQDEGFLRGNYTLHGHRNAKCTDCPGQALYDIIKRWEHFQAHSLPGAACRGK